MEHGEEQLALRRVCALALRHGHDLQAVLEATTAAVASLTGASLGALVARAQDGTADVLVRTGAAPGALPAAALGLAPGPELVRADDLGADGARSALAVPLPVAEAPVEATLLLLHPEPGRFGDAAEGAAVAAATTAGLAVDTALLFAVERAARKEAEDREAVATGSAARTALLQRITALLSTSATTADITARVPAAIVEALDCASAAVHVLDPVRGVLTGSGSPPTSGPGVQALEADTPVAEAARTRRPVTSLRDGAGRVRSGIAVPMLSQDQRVLGVLEVTWADATRPAEDVGLLAGVVAQVALAIERAQLLDAERAAREDLAASVAALTDLARTLQRGLLPRHLPSLARVDVAVRYQPAVVGAEVGGDWYDAIRTDDSVVFVIGDVQGHSTTAAGLMGQLRTAVRAYASEGHGPAAVLERTNRLLVGLGDELFATCCLVQLDQATGDVAVATAGHPLPLVSDERGLHELLTDPGPPLGVVEDAEYTQRTHRLRGRSRVVLYTDGVVESPADQLTSGEAALRSTLARHTEDSSEDLATAIMTSIPHRLDDDAAMLVLQYAGPTAVREEATLPLPPDLRAVADARAFLRTALRAWGGEGLTDSAELVLSELVTNAMVHTDGEATVSLRYDPTARRLTISVQDGSSRHPRERDADSEALGGRGLAIVDAVAAEWGVSMDGEGKAVWADVAG